MPTTTPAPPADIALLIEVREAAKTGHAAQLRRAAGLSQREVAQAIGVTAGCITRWETGERRPTGERAITYGLVLRELARAVTR